MNKEKRLYKRLNWGIGIIYIVTVIVFGVFAVQDGDIEGIAQAVLAPLLLLIPAVAYKLFRIKPMPDLSFMIYLYCYMAYVLGVVGSLYRTTQYFDKAMHVLAGFFFCFIGFGAYYYLKHGHSIEGKKDFPLASVFSFTFSMAIGALWEMMEYFSDTFLGMNVQHVPETGVGDTMQDIYACFFGALFFILLMYFYLEKKKQVYPCTVVEEFVEIMKTDKKKSGRKG